MSRPHPSLSAIDSERTLILQRRNNLKSNTNRRVSAYFDCSDTSGESRQEGEVTTGRGGASAGATTAATSSRSLSRTGGRWVLEGIRRSQQGRLQNPGDERTISDRNDAAPRVFYGSVRFPASRVALWNRRATGSPITITPESAVPLLVLRQRAADLIALALSQAAEAEQERETEGGRSDVPRLRWHGLLGSAGDVLDGSTIASDPRLAAAAAVSPSFPSSSPSPSPSSGLALEVVGTRKGETMALMAAAASSSMRRKQQQQAGWGSNRDGTMQSSGRRRGTQGPQERFVELSGGLLRRKEWPARDWDGHASSERGEIALRGWGRGRDGDDEDVSDDEQYWTLLNDCTKRIAGAKSADPAVFTPLRLQCSLKRRRGASEGNSNNGRDALDSRRRQPEGSPAGLPNGRQAAFPRGAAATLSLRGEMVVPALGVRLTPIAAPALLHTALYQSLLTRGAEDKLQSGLVTLNEGRRAVLLADNDPLSFRAPIVGVWVSGGGGGMSAAGRQLQQQHHGSRRPSPLSHPYTYPACLRFLLGFRGGGGGRGASKASAASPAAFLVLQLPGGVGGGTPSCFEACALPADDAPTSTSAAATPASTAAGSEDLTASSIGFEQLDFSADVDVTVGLRDGEDGGHGGAGGRGGSSANRTVVIGRLRRVSSLSAAGGAFGRALARARGRSRAAQQEAKGATAPPYLPAPSTLPASTSAPPQPFPQQPLETIGTNGIHRWHRRHQPADAAEEDGEAHTQQDRPLRPPAPMAAPTKPTIHSPSFARQRDGSPADNAGDVTTTSVINTPDAFRSNARHRSTSPAKTRGGLGTSRPFGARLDYDGMVDGTGHRREEAKQPNEGRESPRGLEAERGEVPRRPASEGDESPRDGDGGSGNGNFGGERSAAAGGRGRFSSPPTSPEEGAAISSPSAPAATAVGPSSASQAGFDALALDPAAREYILSQQRQLSALEGQLRRLMATVRDQQGNPPIQQENQPIQQVNQSIQQDDRPIQQQQQQQPIHVSVDHSPLLSVSSSAAGPVLTVRAANSTAAAMWARQATPSSPPEMIHGAGATREGGPIKSTVEAATNTSFYWGPSHLPEGGNNLRASEDPAADAATTAATMTTTTATFSAAAATAAAAPSVPTTAGNSAKLEETLPVERRTDGSEAERGISKAESGVLPAGGRDVPRSDSTAPDKDAAAAAAPGWTTQRGRRSEAGELGRRRRMRRRGSIDRRDGGDFGDDAGGGAAPDPAAAAAAATGWSSSSELDLEEENRLLEAPSLGLPRLQSLRRDRRSGSGEVTRRRAWSRSAWGRSGDPAVGEDDKASRTTQEDEEEEEAEEKEEEEEEEGQADDQEVGEAEHQAWGAAGVVTPDGRHDSVFARRDGNDSRGHRGSLRGQEQQRHQEQQRRRRRPLPLLAGGRREGTGGSAGVPLMIPIADLMAVPRIEFEQLTDDEMSSDLDEGETIGWIESKYLQRR